MQRTQLYLSRRELTVLDREARRSGRTRSQLVRDAIAAVHLAGPTPQDREIALRESAGAWRRARGEADGAAWVERLRPGRLARLRGAG